MTTKDILKALRKSRNYSAQQVADGCEMSLGVYKKYESGERGVGVPALQKLADFYGVTTDYLLGRPTAPEPKTPDQLLATLAELKSFDELELALFEQYMQMPEEVRKRMIQFMHSAADMAAAKKRGKVEQSQKECARTAPAQNTPNTPDTELMQESPVIDDEP